MIKYLECNNRSYKVLVPDFSLRSSNRNGSRKTTTFDRAFIATIFSENSVTFKNLLGLDYATPPFNYGKDGDINSLMSSLKNEFINRKTENDIKDDNSGVTDEAKSEIHPNDESNEINSNELNFDESKNFWKSKEDIEKDRKIR